ncbi:hypothetical protein [Hyphomicrobium sp.]|uniref:hypothetical protein n=1 Tax=Hyphomicrobium sp. TaxID=82 RepID=UPI0025C2A703|nr:hypothetical protein [Hyphomicrobium sp.]MCC7254033.1 hypothetical protein [Hyphomicrobium sp.]
MKRPLSARLVGLVVSGLVIGCIATALAAHATIQEESCIDPDIEYPVPCDEDDGD